MDPAIEQRCYNHGDREAVVRCPECRRFFCRECVTEHDDRMLCSACLNRLSGTAQTPRRQWLRFGGGLAQGIFGFVVLWAMFYLAGRILLAIPHSFHEGTIWQNEWWRMP